MLIFKGTKKLESGIDEAVFLYEAEANLWCIDNGVGTDSIETIILHNQSNDSSYILEYKGIDKKPRYKRLCVLGWQYWDEKTNSWYLEQEVSPKTTPEYLYLIKNGINIIRSSSYMFYYCNGVVYEHTPQVRDYLSGLKSDNKEFEVYSLEYYPGDDTNLDYFLCASLADEANVVKYGRDSSNLSLSIDPKINFQASSISPDDIAIWYEVISGKRAFSVITFEYCPGFEPSFGWRYVNSNNDLRPLHKGRVHKAS